VSRVELQNLVKKFGANEVIPTLNLSIESGKLTVLLGPSGCGKSTLLRLIAGLESPDTGKILVDDEDITSLEPRKRNVAMVFQNYALYPHLTIRENLAFPLQVAKREKAEIAQKVAATAELLGLTVMLDRYPKTLSGGERQRTAVGRAIIRDPRLFLLDEPLSNLDFQLRNQMRGEIKSLQQRLGKTMIFVTHDQTEAMSMADSLVVLDKGRITQQGTPDQIYRFPANVFTARFIGSPPMSFLRCSAQNGKLTLDPGDLQLCQTQTPNGRYLVGVRPDHLTASDDGTGVALTVQGVEFHGAATYLSGVIGGQQLVVRGRHDRPYACGDRATVALEPGQLHFFDPETLKRVK
jgi:multiple sugar transport system ATP-binding protein